MNTTINTVPLALSRAECLGLLATVTTGRLATSRKAMPVIVPVRICLLANEVIVESLIGGAIPLSAGSVVALEAGTIGQPSPTEWTVQVCGFLVADDRRRANSADGVDGLRFRLSADALSGWRVGVTGSPLP